MKKTLLITALFIAVLTIINFQEVKAIPAFARKYQTSCNTCHTVYPQLNPFGEAFRINGFQFPKDDDEQTKEKPVELGSEGYKKVWPDAVWPNFMPGSVPISLRGRTAFTIGTDTLGNTTSEFGLPSLQILLAGAFGKDISVWMGAHLFEAGMTGGIDNFYIKFDNLLDNYIPEKALYVRIGQFIPEMVPFATHHRGLTESAYAMNTYSPSMGASFVAGHTHGAGPFGIEKFQLGVEASGVLASRIRYVAGLVNGNGTMEDNNSGKDFYGRLAYKIGGQALDGTNAQGDTNQTSSAYTGETSFTLGGFGYHGTGTTTGDLTDYNFYRAGGDFNLQLRNLWLVGGFITGTDGLNQTKYNLFFGEMQYFIYPWLVGILRYEQANPEGLAPIKQVVVDFTSLIVANVKVKAETRINPDKLSRYNAFLGLDFAF